MITLYLTCELIVKHSLVSRRRAGCRKVGEVERMTDTWLTNRITPYASLVYPGLVVYSRTYLNIWKGLLESSLQQLFNFR